MLVAFDVDGTIDAYPEVCQSLMSALRAAGQRVVVITGCGADTPTPQDTIDKTGYLASLGCANCYDQLVVLGNPTDELKAKWLKANNADLLIDNDKGNAKAAAEVCPVFVPWQTRVK